MPEMAGMPGMNDKRDDRFLDELLDSSLARYAQAEPRPGLEGRLLARLRSEPEPAFAAWRWLPMAAAAVLAFAAVLYFVSGRESRAPEVAVQPKPAVAPTVTAPQAPQKTSAPAVARRTGQQPAAPHALVGAASARRQQFPSPAALSEQEAALVRFVSQTPREELQVLARQNRAEPIQDLRVDALDIPPVVVGETWSR